VTVSNPIGTTPALPSGSNKTKKRRSFSIVDASIDEHHGSVAILFRSVPSQH
jgi:hypothetical protein